MTITEALSDLRDRAADERDATAYSALVETLKYLPHAAASAAVPDVRGQAPFRPGDR
jgi:hypothetical protein